MHIKIKKGLNIPIAGLPALAELKVMEPPHFAALDLSYFDTVNYFDFLVSEGDHVLIGQPLARDKACLERIFLSPACGKIKEIQRGEKRHPLKVVIEAEPDDFYKHEILDLNSQPTPDAIFKYFIKSGLIGPIRKRPCNVLASLKTLPQAIFVRFIESAPFTPKASLALKDEQEFVLYGLKVLSALCKDNVHVVCDVEIDPSFFKDQEHLKIHTAEGPHPISSFSLHLQHIRPVLDASDQVWTLDVQDVITVGKMAKTGRYHHTKIVALAGDIIPESQRGYFKVNIGQQIGDLLKNIKIEKPHRVVSGDPLMGEKSSGEGFLGLKHYVVCLIEEQIVRETMHFFRLGIDKFTATRTYMSALVKFFKKHFHFTTSQHGEIRAFVDADVYQKVMPLNIPIMELVKAALSNNHEKAVDLGLLEISEEDFALPTFVCPSKIVMTDIIKKSLRTYASQHLSD